MALEKEKIDLLYNELIEENKKINLTSITDYNDFIEKHVNDSLLGAEFVHGNVLDIGSGAGFPAIILKLNNDQLNITMIDGTNKKVNYLNNTVGKLNLNNITAVHSRIEDFKKKEYFDTVTARAVAPLRTLIEYALPFLKIGGTLVAYKSSDIDIEVNESKNALNLLGGKIEKIIEKQLNCETTRKFVIIKKIRKTDPKYPRGQNKPRTNPL